MRCHGEDVGHACPYPWFDGPLLDEMPWGVIELRVPLLGDVIPIGVGGNLPTSRIRVCSDGHWVRVRRIDGKPIQVALITGSAEQIRRCNVFRRPIEELLLMRVGVGRGAPGRYRPANGIDATSMQNLKQLADTIATFATAKRRASVSCPGPPLRRTPDTLAEAPVQTASAGTMGR